MPEGPLERLAYESALRSMEDQAGELNQLRAQTGTLLAAGSITASFLGAQTLGKAGELGTFGSVALVAFVVSTLAAIYVLLPKANLVFSLNVPILYENLFGEDEPDVHRTLAYWLEDYWQTNRSKMDVMVIWFFVAAGALTAEVVCWALALRGTLT